MADDRIRSLVVVHLVGHWVVRLFHIIEANHRDPELILSLIAESSDDTFAETAVVLRDQAQRVKREHDLPLASAVPCAGIECKVVGGDVEVCSHAGMRGLEDKVLQ